MVKNVKKWPISRVTNNLSTKVCCSQMNLRPLMVEINYTSLVNCVVCRQLSPRSVMVHMGHTTGGGLGALFPGVI